MLAKRAIKPAQLFDWDNVPRGGTFPFDNDSSVGPELFQKLQDGRPALIDVRLNFGTSSAAWALFDEKDHIRFSAGLLFVDTRQLNLERTSNMLKLWLLRILCIGTENIAEARPRFFHPMQPHENFSQFVIAAEARTFFHRFFKRQLWRDAARGEECDKVRMNVD